MNDLKRCACGNTAWFGKYCHDCRHALLEGVCVKHRFTTNHTDGAAPNGHAAMRRPMSACTLATMDRKNIDTIEPQDGDEGD